MSNEITTWLDAYVELQATAVESRGFVELHNVRWPRTSGHDIVAIAVVLDPYVRDQAHRFGARGIGRRWRAVLEDLERFALSDLRAEFRENRAFWTATLPAICAYLSVEGAPLLPPEVWDALRAVLSDALAFRNVGKDSPFQSFDVKTWDDLFMAQWRYLVDARGSDDLAPEAGMTGTKRKTPRTTNADVIALADYWSKKFADVKEVFGHKDALTRWKGALANIDAVARNGDPAAVYPKNNGFWRDLKATAIHIAVADEAPTKWDMAKDAITESVKNLPENIKAGAEKAATALASAAGDVAHGVGKIANEAGKGLFSGFGGPLLVGAGLLGLFLISRNRAPTEKSS